MTLLLQSPETICRKFGERSRALRISSNLSQQDLALMTGASLSTIRRFEAQGQGTLQLWIRIAFALGAVDDVERLVSDEHSYVTIAQIQAQMKFLGRQRARKKNAPKKQEAPLR